MTFWVLAGLMAAFCVVLLLLPLLRKPAVNADGAAYDLEIYKAQLVEIQRDLARGEISQAEADAARTEIGRRLLAADQARSRAATPAGQPRWVWPIGFITALAVPMLGVLVYLDLGRPLEPAQPFTGRAAERAAQAEQNANLAAFRKEADALEAGLGDRAEDVDGWMRLGSMRMALEDYGRAAAAFGRARALAPQEPEILASEAEALIAAAQGSVGENAQELLQQVLTLDEGNLRARFYLADADWQAGRRDKAMLAWADLRRQSPADAPWQGIVEARIRRGAAEMGVADVASLLPDPLPPTTQPRGPDAGDVAAAQGMSAEDREAMIGGMVESLAARLQDKPEDLAGWMQLIRSYTVLNRSEEALKALGQALSVFDGRQQETAQLMALSHDLQMVTPEDTLPAGPSAAALAAARDKPLEERRATLGADADALARWLGANPDVLQGWVRLAHVRRLLEQPGQERDALMQATRLAPDNVALWRALGRAAFEANGRQIGPDSEAAMARLIDLKPDDVEAHWMLALARLAAGDKDAANTHFTQALNGLPPDSEQRRQLRAEADKLLQGE